MRRLVLPLLVLAACTPKPPPQTQIPQLSELAGKGYQDMVATTKLTGSLDSEQIEVHLILPEMKAASLDEMAKEKGWSEEELKASKEYALMEDTVAIQFQITAVSEVGADLGSWDISLSDDTGKTATGKILGNRVTGPQRAAVSSTGQRSYIQIGQMGFEVPDGEKQKPYQLGAAKKVMIKFARKSNGKAVEMTWLLPADHKQPASMPSGNPAPPAGAAVPASAPN